MRRFTASAEDAGRRLDLYLSSRLPDVSRTRIQELIDEGRVRLGGRLVRRAQRVMSGDVIDIEVLPRPPLRAAPEEIALDVLYEDEDVAVVNKPAGMVVHAGAGAAKGTLVNALLHHFGALSTVGGGLRPGIVHRLDRGTSGAIVIARNDAAHRNLGEQFRSRAVRKTYIALVHGKLSRDAGKIDRPISRDPQRRTRMTARLASGRAAQTNWRALAAPGEFHVGRSRAAHRAHPPDSSAFCGHRASAGWRHALRRAGASPRRRTASQAAGARVSARRSPGLRAPTNRRDDRVARSAGSRIGRLPERAGASARF